MELELTPPQRELRTEILESAQKDRVHELHRTDSLSYKQLLRRNLAMIKELNDRIGTVKLAG